ncbi:LamG-like jellyroll fold domain-containing protein [Fibrobacterota bacterium]
MKSSCLNRKLLVNIVTFFFICISFSFGQTTRYVDYTASGANDGSSWANAHTELYYGIQASALGDSILVAQGVYKATGNNVRDSSFAFKGYQKVVGGYSNGGGPRDYKNNPTTLSGDIGAIGDSSDNSFHVVKIFNENQVVLDGFIIEGGYADGGGDKDYGGGIYMGLGWYMNTVRNCIIRKNYAKIRGGGIFSKNLKGIIEKCRIYSNVADSNGGAIFMENDSTHAINCTFVNNSALCGGAIYILRIGSAADSIINCTFTANEAVFGGCFYNDGTGTGHPAIINSILWNDIASDSCNEICNIGGSMPGIKNCDIKGCGGVSWAGAPFGLNMGGNLDTLPYFFDVDGVDNIIGTADDSVKLQDGSLCYFAGAGGSMIPSEDIEGYGRGAQPTLGAYENTVMPASGKTWENAAGDGRWSTDINWYPDGVPHGTDTVTFNGAVTNAACSLNVNDTVAILDFANAPGMFDFKTCTLYIRENVDFSGATQINAGNGMISFVGIGNQILIPKQGILLPVIKQNSSFTTYVLNNSFRSNGLIVNQGGFGLGDYGAHDTINFFKGTGGTLSFGDAELCIINDSAYFRYTTTYADSGMLIFAGPGAQYFTPGSGTFPDVVTNSTTNITVIDSNNLYMKSLTINVGGTFTAPQNNWMHIKGSFINNGTFNHNGGHVEFDSTSGVHTIYPGGDPFNNVTFGVGGAMARYDLTGPFAADTIRVEYDTLNLGSFTHNVNVISYGMSSELDFNACTLKVNGTADFSGFEGINVGTGVLELTAPDTQTIKLPYNKTLPSVLHSGPGKLKLDYDTLDAVSFVQTAGQLDFNYRDIDVSGEFKVLNGTDSAFINLAERKIVAGGDAHFAGQSSSLLNLNPASKCTLTVSGSLTADYATIGNCVALGSQGVADAATCIDSLNNINWLFLDFSAPDNDMILTATPIDIDKVVLSWNPSAIDSLDADSVGIWYTTSGFPDSAYVPGALLAGKYPLIDSVDTVTGLANATTFYFSIMVRDSTENWSGTSASGNKTAKTFSYANLVAYYPFSGNGNDVSGNGNDATNNGATLVFDRFRSPNSAFSFDGSVNYFNTVDSSMPAGIDARTVTAWFRTDVDYPSEMGTLINYGTGTADFQEMYLCIQKSGVDNVVQAGTGGANSHSYGNSIINDGKWHFAAATYNGAAWQLYVDGIDETNYESGSSPTTNTVVNGTTTIGCAVSYDQYFNGSIDDIRIYNRALGSIEIDSLYRLGSWPPPAVVSLSPADNATGVGVSDNLVITFSEAVTIGTGAIKIKRFSDDSTVDSLAGVSGSGTSTITIDPSITFESETIYYVVIDSTFFIDDGGNRFAGMYSNSAWNFMTVDAVTDLPTLSVPSAGSTIADSFNIDFFLPENAASGSVKMIFTRSTGTADPNAPHVITFISDYETAGSHSTVLQGKNLSNNGNISSVSSDPDDALVKDAVYDVRIEYQDVNGNPVAQITNPQVLYTGGDLGNDVSATLTNSGNNAVIISLTRSTTPISSVAGIYFNLALDTVFIDTATALRFPYDDTTFVIANITTQGTYYGAWVLFDSAGNMGLMRCDSVAIGNVAPVLSLPAVDTAYEDSLWIITNFASDLNNDPLVLSLISQITGMSISSSSQTITWTPTNSDIGSHMVIVKADDGKNGIDIDTMTLRVLGTNVSPVLSLPGSVTLLEDTAWAIDNFVSDINGDSIILALRNAPAGMTVDQSALSITWIPRNDDVGTYSVTVIASDPKGAADSAVMSITVLNINDYPLIFSATFPDTAYEDSLVVGTIGVSDPDDGDTVFLTFSPDVPWLDIEVTQGSVDSIWQFTIKGTPTNAYTGSIQFMSYVSDREGLVVTANHQIFVINTNDPPNTLLNNKERAYGALLYSLKGIDDSDTMVTFFANINDSANRFDSSMTNTNGLFPIYPLLNGRYIFSCYTKDKEGLNDPTPYKDTVTISGASTHTWSDSGVWDMVSIPASSYNAAPFKSAGVILHWDESRNPSGIYKYYTRSDGIHALTAGKSYWTRMDKPVAVALHKDSLCKDSIPVYLHKSEYGWNQVASPYTYPVQWAKPSTLWEWDPVSLDFKMSTSSIMYPWIGYWTFTEAADTVYLSPQPIFIAKDLKRQPLTSFENTKAWTFGIELTTNVNRDADNLFGVNKNARDGYDVLDRPEPPRMGSEPYLFFAHPEWKRTIDRFASDIRRTWDSKVNIFQIGISPCERDVTALTLNITGFSEEAPIYLFVNNRSDIVEYKPGMTLEIEPSDKEQYRTIFATADKDFLNTFPQKFMLNNPYPNPCRPLTTIRYTLPYNFGNNGWLDTKPYRVRMIIYDVKGRVVRELVNRKQKPGYYKVIWRGKGDTGRYVASGTYFCRLTAGKYSSVKKIIAIR